MLIGRDGTTAEKNVTYTAQLFLRDQREQIGMGKVINAIPYTTSQDHQHGERFFKKKKNPSTMEPYEKFF